MNFMHYLCERFYCLLVRVIAVRKISYAFCKRLNVYPNRCRFGEFSHTHTHKHTFTHVFVFENTPSIDNAQGKNDLLPSNIRHSLSFYHCIMCCSHKCVTIYNTLIQLSIYTLDIVVMGLVLKCDFLATSKEGDF